MFQFAGFASTPYEFRCGYRICGGFPHSDISGSKIAPISPELFAGCHVLHRLPVPRHPPDALVTLESPCAGKKPLHTEHSIHTLCVEHAVLHGIAIRASGRHVPACNPTRSLDPLIACFFTMNNNETVSGHRPERISLQSVRRGGGGYRDRTDDL